jgi:Domain of unknown function (DUF5076)
MSKSNELPVPPSSQSSERALEVMRVWINPDNNNMDVTLRSAFADPASWGILLVDIARHVGRAYEAEGDRTQADATARVRAAFDAEWGNPTDSGRTTKI